MTIRRVSNPVGTSTIGAGAVPFIAGMLDAIENDPSPLNIAFVVGGALVAVLGEIIRRQDPES